MFKDVANNIATYLLVFNGANNMISGTLKLLRVVEHVYPNHT